MKAILIDPHNQLITETDCSDSKIAEVIGCDLFQAIYINPRNVLYVDEEGVFKKDQRFWRWGKFPHPLAGKGLILGCNKEGESVDQSLKHALAHVVGQVSWLPATMQFVNIKTFEGTAELFGRRVPAIVNKNVYRGISPEEMFGLDIILQ